MTRLKISILKTLGLASALIPVLGMASTGLQFSYVPASGAGIGVVHYAPQYLVGAAASGKFNDNPTGKTNLANFSMFGGLRKSVTQNSFFAYGLEAGLNEGRISGEKLQHSYSLSGFLEYQFQLNPHFMLTSWINPYTYKQEKKAYVNTHEHMFFSVGGIALAYLI